MEENLFPLGIATGAAFCNRQGERRQLAGNIIRGRHTWLMARRRYGKSSVVAQTLIDLARRRTPLQELTVDLLVTHDASSLERMIREAVGILTGKILPANQKILRYLRDVFGSLKPELVIGERGPRVRLITGEAPQETILAALTGLDRIARRYKARAVLVFDEFQQLGRVRGHESLEGAIRHAVERARHVSYVFLGSERQLLAELFENPERPLYRLCERLNLERISAADYAQFLSDAATLRWQRKLSGPARDAILSLSLRHPYYLNALCGRVWTRRHPPTRDAVESEWRRYVEDERHRVSGAIVHLSANQRAVLAALARESTSQPNAQAFLQRVRLSSASVRQAIDVLTQKDLIAAGEQGALTLVDPVLATYLGCL